MPDRTKVIGDTDLSHRSSESFDQRKIDQTAAAISAHCIMTESLIHALCFELPELSRARILNVLDLVYNELEEGLGDEAEIVRAFGEQRDSLRALLVSSLIKARLELGQ